MQTTFCLDAELKRALKVPTVGHSKKIKPRKRPI